MLILWYIDPFGRQWPVAFGLQPGYQIAYVLIQILSIFLPTDTVNATGSVPAEIKVAFLQESLVQQMS
jgi:hypothetical protein